MWFTELDKARRLLKIRFTGQVGPKDASACLDRIESLLPEVEPGFVLLSDLTDLESMDLACEPMIDQVMDACNKHGVGKVIRVVPDPRKDIGLGIMSLFHYGPNVRVVTCSSLAEAQSHLPS